MTEAEDRAFRELCREYLNLPIEERIKRGFRLEQRLIPGDRTSRAFSTLAEYRAWCEVNLPEQLGFRRVSTSAACHSEGFDTDIEEASLRLRFMLARSLAERRRLS